MDSDIIKVADWHWLSWHSALIRPQLNARSSALFYIKQARLEKKIDPAALRASV